MRRVSIVLLILTLLVTAVASWPAPARAHEVLAVLPFENNSVTDPAAYAPLEQGLMAMLISDLVSGGAGVRVVERARIREVLEEIALGQSGAVDQATAVEAGRLLGARHIAFGSFMVMGETVRMDARVVSVETSEVVLADAVMGQAGSFMALERDLAGRIAGALRLTLSPLASTGGLDAAVLFSRAVNALDAGERDAAQELFGQATALDPGLAGAARSLLGP